MNGDLPSQYSSMLAVAKSETLTVLLVWLAMLAPST